MNIFPNTDFCIYSKPFNFSFLLRMVEDDNIFLYKKSDVSFDLEKGLSDVLLGRIINVEGYSDEQGFLHVVCDEKLFALYEFYKNKYSFTEVYFNSLNLYSRRKIYSLIINIETFEYKTVGVFPQYITDKVNELKTDKYQTLKK